MRLAALILLAALTARASSVILEWIPSESTNAIGTKIYSAPCGKSLTNSIDAGNKNRLLVTGLDPGARYHFAATAYAAQTNESGFSNECTWPHDGGAPLLIY